MDLFDLETPHDQNCRDMIFSFTELDTPISISLEPLAFQTQQKRECETYAWIWKDEEAAFEQVDQCENKMIEEIKAARAQQQEKIKKFISNLKPIVIGRKVSEDVETESGSPKRKKIRKIICNK